MRILFLTNSLAVRAGIERTLTDKANYLAEQGHEVTFVTYQQGLHPISFPLFPTIIHRDIDCRAFLLYKYPFLRRCYETIKLKFLFWWRFKTIVRQFLPDIVITTTNSSEFVTEIMRVCKHIPVVIESHIAYTAQEDLSTLPKRLSWRFKLSAYKRCSLFIALTEGDTACWKKHLCHVKKISNPVTCYVESPFLHEREEGRIISVGRMDNNQKRFDRLIDAFSLLSPKFPTWHIDIYGEGTLRQSLQEQIDSLKLTDKVIIHQPSTDIYSEYLRSELFVLSSDYEGFGLVIVEAMACGVPVISTDCPFGPSDIIDDGISGLLAAMDVNDLEKKIEWMITHSEERQEIAAKGHEIARQYKLDNAMKEWLEAYQSVLTSNK